MDLESAFWPIGYLPTPPLILQEAEFSIHDPVQQFPIDVDPVANVTTRQHTSPALVEELGTVATTPTEKAQKNKKDAFKGDTPHKDQACLRTRAEYSCGHQSNQSNHRDGCQKGKRCSQALEARIPEKLAKPCRTCSAAAKTNETRQDVKEASPQIDEDYLHKSVHTKLMKKLDKGTPEKGENLLVKGGTAVLERVATHLAMQRIEKRLAARGSNRRLEETPVIVERDDAEEFLDGDDAWEQVEAADADWVEIGRDEGDVLEH